MKNYEYHKSTYDSASNEDKRKWIGHTLRKTTGSIEKITFIWTTNLIWKSKTKPS